MLLVSLSQQSNLDLISVQPESGRIFLVRGVALEDVGSEFTAVIRATDGGSPMLFSTTRIEVHVLNCTNDTFRYPSGHGYCHTAGSVVFPIIM